MLSGSASFSHEAVRLWFRRLREARAGREELQKKIREIFREVRGWEVAGGAFTDIVDGVLKPLVKAWTESTKTAKESMHKAGTRAMLMQPAVLKAG